MFSFLQAMIELDTLFTTVEQYDEMTIEQLQVSFSSISIGLGCRLVRKVQRSAGPHEMLWHIHCLEQIMAHSNISLAHMCDASTRLFVGQTRHVICPRRSPPLHPSELLVESAC